MKAILAVLALFLAAGAAAESPERVAPDFSLPGLHDGEIVSLADYRGRYVLVDFWASWCPPCRKSLPFYQQLKDRLTAGYGADSFEVVAINVDISAEEGRHFLEGESIDFPVLREETGATQRAYNLMAMPTAYLVGPDGTLIFEYSGFSRHHGEVLESHLRERLEPVASQAE